MAAPTVREAAFVAVTAVAMAAMVEAVFAVVRLMLLRMWWR